MVGAAKADGLRVSIEPHLDSMAQTPQTALALVEQVEGLEITLDWAHFICQNLPYDEMIKLLPKTRHVQIRQAARNQLQTPFDRGKLDVARVVSELDAVGYAGVVCVEYMNMPGWHGMIAVDAIRESTRMRDVLREARDKKK
jgi:sugar phosphate isomerase/epimerase